MLNYEEVKQRILVMLKEMIEAFPPMIRTMAQMQFGTVTQLVNNMTDEQIETFERFAAGKRDDALLMLLTGIRRGEMLAVVARRAATSG